LARVNRRPPTAAALAGAAVVLVLAAAGCGGKSGGPASATATVGKPEGQLSLVSLGGQVENGQTKGVDWVTPFERASGCQVSNHVIANGGEAIRLLGSGKIDGVSALGTVAVPLIANGMVQPLQRKLLLRYRSLSPDLQRLSYNTVEGQIWGMPVGRGANVLVYNPRQVRPAPRSWGAVLDPAQAAAHKGGISVYDDPIYIADAALYLSKHRPSLGITDPYELTEDQFNAAVELLTRQQPDVGQYWSDFHQQVPSFAGGHSLIGTTWQYGLETMRRKGARVATSPKSQGYLPSEGATGWAVSWMMSARAPHPACMYRWMNWVARPQINAQISQRFGEAPSVPAACRYTKPGFCTAYHATDAAFWRRIRYWKGPQTDCGNGSEDCEGAKSWVNAWAEIKGEQPTVNGGD